VLLVLMLSGSSMTQTSPTVSCQSASAEIVAARVSGPIVLDAGHPSKEWERAAPISFCEDWQGKNAAPERATMVRALWSPEMLYLRFECRYTQVTVFADSEPNGRRDHLWDRDVAETFLQPDPSREKFYKEFEVAPNGMWIDLDIGTGELVDLKSGLTRSVVVDEKAHRWTAELAIPMKALTVSFDPKAEWRVNFFRVEGAAEPRNYYSWRATNTEQPNFHVPKAFGRMRFGE
jgi:alpha-galactosidase